MKLCKSFKRFVFMVILFLCVIPILTFSQVEKFKVEKTAVLDPDIYYFDTETGDYAFRPNGREGIAIFNIKDKTKPVKIGIFSLNDIINDVYSSGNDLYASSNSKIYFMDIANPVSPVLKGSYLSEYTIEGLGVSGNYAYLWHDPINSLNTLLTVVDKSNPQAPKKTGTYENTVGNSIGWGSYFYKSIFSGKYALVYVSEPVSAKHTNIKLYFIDTWNPSMPALAGYYSFGQASLTNPGGDILDFAASGSYVFLAHKTHGLQVLDITKPSAPKLAYEGNNVTGLLQLVRAGNLLFARKTDGILIYNISNPSLPVQVGSYSSSSQTTNIRASETRVGLELQNGLFGILDVSTPSQPKLLREGKFELPDTAVWEIADNTLFIGDTKGNTKLVDVSTPSNPVLLSTYYSNSGSGVLWVSGNYAFSSESNMFKVINISDKKNPVVLGSVTTNLHNIAGTSGNYVYMTSLDGWGIIDITDKSHPNVIFSKTEIANIYESNEDYLYAYDYSNYTLKIIDARDKKNPVDAGSMTLSSHLTVTESVGNYLYVVTEDLKFHVIDISNKSNPVEVKSIDGLDSLSWSYIRRSGNYFYKVNGSGIKIIDISNPTNPVLTSKSFNIKNFENFRVSGNFLIVSTKKSMTTDMSFLVFDISNPNDPVLAGFYDELNAYPSSTTSFVIQGNTVYFPDSGKLAVLSIVPNTQALLRVLYPNGGEDIASGSSSAAQTISWLENKLSGQVKIELYKGGKFYREIATAPTESGSYSYQFPSIIPTASDYSIRISNGNIEDFSNQYFTICSNELHPHYSFANGDHNFSTQVGVNPVPKTITLNVEESGDKSSWSIETSQPWLHASPVSGNGAGSFTISADVAGLSVGTYGGTVIVNIPNATNTKISLPVTLQVFSEAPVILLDKYNLTFNLSRGSSVQPQTVSINCGENELDWWTTINNSSIYVSPNTGKGNGTISVLTAPWSSFFPGTFHGNVFVNSSAASNPHQSINVTINVEDSGDPFGVMAGSHNNETYSGSIAITGWALDNIGVESVKIYRARISTDPGVNPMFLVGTATFVEGARPDVQLAYPNYPNSSKAGWGYMLLTNMLPKADNYANYYSDEDGYFYTLYAVATDKDGHEVTLGQRTIIVDNLHATKPFGAIDTPQQGESIWDNGFWNFGWVLTPQPNMIPTDGSTIDVIIDGVNVGHPVYNVPRSDVSALFPDYANAGGPGGYIAFDAIKLGTGLHTISWNVTDNAGNTDGIGSRYFTVEKPGLDQKNSGMQLETYGNDQTGGLSETDFDTNIESSTESSTSLSDVQRVEISEMERLVIDLSDNEIEMDLNAPLDFDNCRAKKSEIGNSGKDSSSNRLNGYTHLKGYSVIGNLLNRLPLGSTLDPKNGIFYWLPGPGFVGEYHLRFTGKDEQGRYIKKDFFVTIQPKHM